MSHPAQSHIRNSLITAMSADEYALLQPHLAGVTLAKGETLILPNEIIAAVHFPETALASVVTISPEGHKVEGAMVGWEGVTSLAAIHGTDRTPHQVIAQIEGNAWCISPEAFSAALTQSSSLLALMLRYAQSLYIQTTYTALSNATHGVEERLARWLLMCHDRSESDEMALTHEFLSIMLAVRRPSVTTALHVLEGLHLVRAVRGKVILRDRKGLEDFARDAYGIPEAEYARLVGPMPRAAELKAAASRRLANQPIIDALERGSAT